MKLEEILPEIRKGRKYRIVGYGRFYTLNEEATMPLAYFIKQEYELEPLKKEISREDVKRAFMKADGLDLVRPELLELIILELGL